MPSISVTNLTKRFGKVCAVDDLTFTVRPGAVTGFLGRNGAGKTTTLRMIVGLAHPTSGKALVKGQQYSALNSPATVVGSVLDNNSFHPGRSGRNHLRWVAAAMGLPQSRVDEVLEFVELSDVGKRRVKGYSLGMRQRLALATALLPAPEILILDEPANGLDPQGMHWLRELLIAQAKDGKTVLVSSHVLAELAQFADDIVVIDRGRMIKQGPLSEITHTQDSSVRVNTPDAAKLAEALQQQDGTVNQVSDTELLVSGISVNEVGDLALSAGVVIHSLNEEQASLEEAFLQLTADSKETETVT